jgi:hypothetical protein
LSFERSRPGRTDECLLTIDRTIERPLPSKLAREAGSLQLAAFSHSWWGRVRTHSSMSRSLDRLSAKSSFGQPRSRHLSQGVNFAHPRR